MVATADLRWLQRPSPFSSQKIICGRPRLFPNIYPRAVLLVIIKTSTIHEVKFLHRGVPRSDYGLLIIIDEQRVNMSPVQGVSLLRTATTEDSIEALATRAFSVRLPRSPMRPKPRKNKMAGGVLNSHFTCSGRSIPDANYRQCTGTIRNSSSVPATSRTPINSSSRKSVVRKICWVSEGLPLQCYPSDIMFSPPE